MPEYNPFSLRGKTILITGASSGIGKASALECAKMGACVYITGRNEIKLRDTFSNLAEGAHSYIVSDISTEEGIKKVAEHCPPLDGIVHCAGVGDRTFAKEVTPEDIQRVMQINFDAPVLLQKNLLKKKKIKPGASIVFISSRAPFAPSVGNGIYAASKGAVMAYAKVLGLELAPKKIRVNCICPAMVWTDLIEKDSELTGIDYHEKELEYPLGRYGRPDDIAFLAIYLLADVSNWITGSCFDATGGGEFTLK